MVAATLWGAGSSVSVIARDAAKSRTIIAMAAEGDTAPEAIGRRRFLGWVRSASASRTSLRQYTALDAKQNAAKAIMLPMIVDRSAMLPLKNAGSSTNPFLTH